MTTNDWQGRIIRLRAMVPSDISLFETFDDDISRNVDVVYFPQSMQRLQNWFDEEMTKQRNDDSFRWVAENSEGQPVGTIDTFKCNRRFGTFKYGLAVSLQHQGKGYATEIILLVLRYYFHELRYQKVTPHVYSFNHPSLTLHEKLGFNREGQLRNMIYSHGKFFDEIYYGMTRDEFDRRFADETS
ncbi:GNAT family N-acetyltransferase [Alicyclobacillus sp. SO9]|uniref:GNAT family N-acetyltransferase n=1 Tax=Alicyclobacillus sp. SO9 TaxID=2665646 RepID=UPI0018E8BB60|nr:GNAT family protein [Alicyclobacillus sp. SO9]QQE77294.1 GNAT family N-acetyltransferase [Alicyclobacillus sp. SO9]